MTNSEKYIKHSAGVISLMKWLSLMKLIGHKVDIREDFIYLDETVSSYFAICKSQHKNAINPFFMIQKTAFNWMGLMSWDRVEIKEGGKELFLISDIVYGDAQNYSDYKQIVLVFSFDYNEKLNLLKNYEKIDVREVVYDNGEVNINYFNMLCSLPISFIKNNDKVLINEEKIINKNLITQKQVEDLLVFSNYL